MSTPDTTPVHPLLAKLVAVKPGEARALLWSFAYFFCLLAGYYEGWVDWAVMRLIELFSVVPPLLAAMLLLIGYKLAF